MGREFMILTDHASLTHLQTQAHLSRRQARWLDFLGEFKFEVLHIVGKKNVADYFSCLLGSALPCCYCCMHAIVISRCTVDTVVSMYMGVNYTSRVHNISVHMQ